MAFYKFDVKIFSRGKGGCVTRAAAYRAGERIRDATPPLASTRSDTLPKPRAVGKPVIKRPHKPRGQAIKSNGAAAGAPPLDNQASPP